jgi:hypothetical protein
VLAEGARKASRAFDDFGGGLRSGKTNDTLLQVNDDEGGDGIEFCQGHGTSFRLAFFETQEW